MPYYHRAIENTVREYLRLFPVVGLTGPRQLGKSTLLRKLLSAKYRYVSFDDLNVVDRFHTDPERFMEVNSDKVIFDEVQRVPEIFHYVKLIVDNNRDDYGKFIMTGSSQFAFMKRVSESLAGESDSSRCYRFNFQRCLQDFGTNRSTKVDILNLLGVSTVAHTIGTLHISIHI